MTPDARTVVEQHERQCAYLQSCCGIGETARTLLGVLDAAEGLVRDVERGAARVTTAGRDWLTDLRRALATARPGSRCQCGRPFTVVQASDAGKFLQCERRSIEIGHDSIKAEEVQSS